MLTRVMCHVQDLPVFHHFQSQCAIIFEFETDTFSSERHDNVTEHLHI